MNLGEQRGWGGIWHERCRSSAENTTARLRPPITRASAVASNLGDGGRARTATERPRVGNSVQTWTYEPSGCGVTEAKSLWLTFDMRGD
jgi:hypothetical protein